MNFSRTIRSSVVALIFFFKGGKSQGYNYLWNLTASPLESNNLFDDDDYSQEKASLLQKLQVWQDVLIPADTWMTLPNASYIQEQAWIKCGGVCAFLNVSYSLDIEQKYFPDAAENPPNIVFVLVDDWGWNDIGYRSTYMNWTTPTIDKLAQNGIKLDNYFTHSYCVPSRGALMTGRFAGRLGLLESNDGQELPLSEVTLAQELKSAGYRTYMVGKWDLGASSYPRYPTNRGFDSFYGYLSAQITYDTKYYSGYLDLQNGTDIVTDPDETSPDYFSAYLFQEKAKKVLIDHATQYPTTPMFLYYALQLVHYPYDVPENYADRCATMQPESDDNTGFTQDDTYCGMNVMLDEVIANLTCTLSALDLLDNTILIVSSDNGGAPEINGSSVPFRGHKFDFNRGGLSANAFISSALIPEARRGSTYSGQMHLTDWLPTIMYLATGGDWNGSYVGNVIDGVNMWDAIMTDADSPHTDIPHYANTEGAGSIQVNMLKLDVGIYPTGYDSVETFYTEDLLPHNSRVSCDDPSMIDTPTQAPTDGDRPGHDGHDKHRSTTVEPSTAPTEEAPTHVGHDTNHRHRFLSASELIDAGGSAAAVSSLSTFAAWQSAVACLAVVAASVALSIVFRS